MNNMQKRKFKGIWIPASVWLSADMTLLEKVFLAEIDSLSGEENTGCYASNKYFGEFFSLSKRQVCRVINTLLKKGLIRSQIDKAGGNRRLLTLSPEMSIALSPKMSIGSGQDCPQGMDKNGDTPMDKNVTHITNPRLIDNKGDNKSIPVGVVKSSQEVLDLDLKITEKKKFFTEQINRIFHINGKEAGTFAAVIAHFVRGVQAGKLDIGIFADAVEWARQAAASRAINKKGLFVAKVKQETGFVKQKMLLMGKRKF